MMCRIVSCCLFLKKKDSLIQLSNKLFSLHGSSENSQVAWFTMADPFSGLGTTMPASSVEALNHVARISAKNARAEVIDFGAMMRGCAQLTSNTGLPCDGYIQMQESLWYVRTHALHVVRDSRCLCPTSSYC